MNAGAYIGDSGDECRCYLCNRGRTVPVHVVGDEPFAHVLWGDPNPVFTVGSYASDRVFDGIRPVSPWRADQVQANYRRTHAPRHAKAITDPLNAGAFVGFGLLAVIVMAIIWVEWLSR